MTEQVVDLRSTWAVLRRRSGTLLLVALLGGLTGLGLLFVFPPAYTSTSIVLLPAAAQPGSGRTGGYDADTQVLITTSAEILSRAAQRVQPTLTDEQVAERVTVEAPATAVLRIKAEGPSATQAEELASAVAQSLVDYLQESNRALSETQRSTLQGRLDTLTASMAAVEEELAKASSRLSDGSRTSTAGRADAAAISDLTAVRASTVLDIDAVKKRLSGDDVTGGQVAAGANVIQPASPGEQSGLVTDTLAFVLGGAAVAGLLLAVYLLVTNQRDPKLRSRDEIADAVGIPVITSVRARSPRSARAWRELIRGYTPDSPDAWALRQLLHGLVPDAGKEWATSEGFVLIVLTVSGDTPGLAIGPQIASFAAANGIKTQLIAAQHHEDATALWAACSETPGRGDLPANLSITAVPESLDRVGLTVMVVVLDRTAPAPLPHAVAEGTAVLAVSSATVTRRNLADAIIAVDRAGLTVRGIVVANPDPLDRTTGRLSPVERPGSTSPRPTAITTRAGVMAPNGAGAPAGGQRRGAGKGVRSR